MHSLLLDIIKQKHQEVTVLKNKVSLENIKVLPYKRKSFKEAIVTETLSIIGEIKRKSPSKGMINVIENPISLLDKYIAGGIAAVSVLTDEQYFDGSTHDLLQVTNHLENSAIPVLRKEFIIDECQIIESVLLGANAILLIVAVLKENTQRLLDYAHSLGIEVIVEVHTKEELQFAIDIGADIIGINNRDLHTFDENIGTCLGLIKDIPAGIVTIAESAIKTTEHMHKIKSAGFNAVLIGETLVRATDPTALLCEMRTLL